MARKNYTKAAKALKHRNEALYEAMVELRRSNAAQPHEDSRYQRRRTRLGDRTHAIRDSLDA